jgi:hypothetical protein
MSPKLTMKRPIWDFLILGIMAFHPLALAVGEGATERKATKAAKAFMEMNYQKSMKMDEAMQTGMAKPNMMKGNVKANAEKKEPEMRKMMQDEMK